MRPAAIACALLALLPAGCGVVGRSIIGGRTDGCDAGQRWVQSVCVGEGSLGFTLTWDQPGDMDLHVLTPGGHEISFSSPIGEGGILDANDQGGTGPENVVWYDTPAAGNYVVCVVPINIQTATNFVVTARRGGMTVQQWSGMRVTTSGNQACSAMSMFLVGVLPVM